MTLITMQYTCRAAGNGFVKALTRLWDFTGNKIVPVPGNAGFYLANSNITSNSNLFPTVEFINSSLNITKSNSTNV